MLGNSAVKAVQSATFIARSASKIYGKCDSVGTLLRRSKAPSVIPPTLSQQPSTQQSQHFKILFPTTGSYVSISSSSTITTTNALNQIFLQIYQVLGSIPLPFIHNANTIRIGPTTKMQPNSVVTLNNVEIYGLDPTCYFAVTENKFRSTSLPGQLDRHDLPERAHDEIYECMNRNARRGKRANKGKRACSRQLRRKRRRRFGNHRR